MLFNSYIFIVLLTITFALYYIPLFKGLQVWVLIAASLAFYSYTNPVLLILLICSCAINFTASYLVAYPRGLNPRLIALGGVITNLALLAFFKYSPLIAVTLLPASSDVGSFLLAIPLPIGISFFTFQGISLVVDVYKGNHFGNREVISPSFMSHARNSTFFVAFFPQLIAGPIVKAHDFLPQISTKFISNINWEYCFRHLVLGYFLKMVVADNLKDFTFWIAYPYFLEYKTIDLAMMLIGFSCQIFADFAGYSLIAIGLAGLFGYHLRVNFNFPYVASSFKDFWKRWHISLSSFLMEYLYYPLGGNRKGKVRTYFNLFVVMALGGLWHGAAWSYMVWGFAHGVLLAGERFLFDKLAVNTAGFRKATYSVFVFLSVTLLWLLFKLPDFSQVILYLKAMFANPSLSFSKSLFLNIAVYSSPVLLYHLYHLFSNRLKSKSVISFAYGVMLFLIVFNSGSSGAFIYFQF